MAAPQVTAEPQRTLPTAANGTSVTPSATAWANSAYAQMNGAIGAAITIVGVTINAAFPARFEVDIARGAAGVEVVVATAIGHVEGLAGSANHVFLFNIPIDDIAAGQRIACRLRKSGTSISVWTIKLLYYNTVSATVGVTANESLAVPSAADGVSVTPSATAWANSAYAELSASLTDIVALGFVVDPGGTIVTGGTEFELDVAAGAVEVVKGTTGGQWETFAGECCLIPFRVPLSIPGANRIATRLRKAGTDVTAWTVKLLYISSAGFGASDIGRTTQRQRISPDAAALAGNAGSATAWANSAWREQIASTATAIVVVGRTIDTPVASDYETEVGRGPAASEVVISGDGDNRETPLGIPHTVCHCIPVDNIAAAQRVAFRHRDSTTTADTFDTGLTFYEKPL